MATKMRELVDIVPVADTKIVYASMSDLLKSFRLYLERESGTPVQRIETSAVWFLFDLCEFLQLGHAQKNKVLGNSAQLYISQALAEKVSLKH